MPGRGGPTIIRIPGRRRPVPSAGGGPGGGGQGPAAGWPGGPAGPGVPPGFPFPPRQRPVPGRRGGGCCATTLLRLFLLVLLIPVVLLALPYLLSALNGETTSDSAPATTPVASGTSRPTGTSSAATTRATGTGNPSRSSVTLAPTSGTSPVRLDATPCPAGAPPYPGMAVGPGTSCVFAGDTRLAYVTAGAAGQPVTLTVFNAAAGRNVALNCTGAALVTCSSADGAKVYLATGPLRVEG